MKSALVAVDTVLFERGTNDIRITPLGERIVEQARRVLAEAVKLEEIAEATGDPMTGQLRVGIIYTIAPYLLPQLIPALSREAPKMPLFLKEDFTGNLIPALKAGELDVIVIALPFSEPGLVAQPVYDEPFRVVVPATHPWAARSAVSGDELDGQNMLLLGQGNCFRDQVLEACPLCRPGEGLQRTLEGSSLETIRHMVATGAGVARGRVRRIRHPAEGVALQAGEILLAPATDPGWTPLFLKAGGLVVETGGYLSHAAIVAREFALPAVVNLPGIMEVLQDGEWVEVDGGRGVVRRVGEG